MTTLDKTANVGVAQGFRLQWEEAQSCHVLLYPEGMIKLNQSAGEIMSRIGNGTTVAGLIEELKTAFPNADLEQDVLDFLQTAHSRGWIDIND
jgi:pyrroloquinoline quinone biosynthesis protein D